MPEPRNFTNHQKKIISRYYDNRDQLDEQRLAELVTSLYLATSEKALAKSWTSAEELMRRLGTPETRIKHVCENKDPAILAEVVKDVQKGLIKPPAPKPQGDS